MAAIPLSLRRLNVAVKPLKCLFKTWAAGMVEWKNIAVYPGIRGDCLVNLTAASK